MGARLEERGIRGSMITEVDGNAAKEQHRKRGYALEQACWACTLGRKGTRV